MIYVVANSVYEAVAFSAYAHLGSAVKLFTEPSSLAGMRFQEDDEVFVLNSTDETLRREARISHDKSWPRPHIYREISYERDTATSVA